MLYIAKSMPNYIPEKLVQIPEDVLDDLLRQAGINDAPKQFLGRHKHKITAGEIYQKRAKVAYWSIMWLGFSAMFSLLCFAKFRDFEDFISVVSLGAMTYTEFRVRKWFIEGDSRGSIYGYWNQTGFAVFFLIYGAYHALTPPELLSSPIFSEVFGAEQLALIATTVKMCYAIIGIVCAACQYSLALYYKRSLNPETFATAKLPPQLP